MKDNLFILALPGILLSLLLSTGGYFLSKYHPLLDAFFIAFLGAVIVGGLFGKKAWLWVGTGLCKDLLIPVGLFLYGTQINLKKWANVDPWAFAICLINILLYFVIIFLCNRYIFQIKNAKLSFLTGGASGICGVSATAVFIPFVDAKEDEVASTLLAVLITGLVSVFATWYIIQQNMAFITSQYATLTGSTLNQTGAVKAAADFMSKEAVISALTLKFFRTSLIIPVALVLMFLSHAFSQEEISRETKFSAIKYGIFIAVLFFGGSLLFTFTGLHSYAGTVKPWFKILFGMTLASVGLLCNLRKAMKKELLLNMISSLIGWVAVAAAATMMIRHWIE